jgi:hypothetical protein
MYGKKINIEKFGKMGYQAGGLQKIGQILKIIKKGKLIEKTEKFN